MRVTFSNLPFETIGQMTVATMGRYESELLGITWKQMAFYSFFKTVYGVEGRVIRELTHAPIASPTTEEYNAGSPSSRSSWRQWAGTSPSSWA